MALEFIDTDLWNFKPGICDVHTHPRAEDAITNDIGDLRGKAGLQAYTEVALASGITVMLAMPNESIRLVGEDKLMPYPIFNLDRVLAVAAAISHESVIPTGIIQGIDPEQIFIDKDQQLLDEDRIHQEFAAAESWVAALKLWGDLSTGGNNIDIKHIPRLVSIWHEHNPTKPTVLHLENENVGKVLEAVAKLPNGKDIPLHIAHVSSKLELQAIKEAKKAGMNVTCEVTPHHLFMDESAVGEIGAYANMKPSLKTKEDVEYLWANMQYIDIIASDCAPHSQQDKEAASPAWGVANHTVMLPLLLGAVQEGKISLEQLYEKMCIAPRRRFNLPLEDGSRTMFKTGTSSLTVAKLNERANLRYGQDPFSRLEKLNKQFRLGGYAVRTEAGLSWHNGDVPSHKTSRTHLIRPEAA